MERHLGGNILGEVPTAPNETGLWTGPERSTILAQPRVSVPGRARAPPGSSEIGKADPVDKSRRHSAAGIELLTKSCHITSNYNQKRGRRAAWGKVGPRAVHRARGVGSGSSNEAVCRLTKRTKRTKCDGLKPNVELLFLDDPVRRNVL